MTVITDEEMKRGLAAAKGYSIVILKATPRRRELGADKIVWEHGRRNFALRKEGKLSIVCRGRGEGELAGLCIFSTSAEETRRLMDQDPAVKAGVLTYALQPVAGFPGDALAK